MKQSIIDPIGTYYGPAPLIIPVDSTLSRSFNMRLLIHYFGDIHQPLHSTSRFTADYPNGDQGGNLFKIAPSGLDGEINNLHSVWDSVVYSYIDDQPQPLSEESWLFFAKESFDI